jgi:uncharacterized protein
MSEQENLTLVRNAYEAFGRGDIEAVIAALDENVEWCPGGPPPVGGVRHGRAAVREFFRVLDAVFDVQQFEPHEFIPRGDRVVVLGSDTSVLRATGTPHTTRWAHVYRVENGRIARLDEYADFSSVTLELRSPPLSA